MTLDKYYEGDELERLRDKSREIRNNLDQQVNDSRSVSLSLFRDQKKKGKVKFQKDQIEEFLRKKGSPKTRKEIYHQSKVDAQPSTISARLKALIRDGKVEKFGKRPCKCGYCDHNRSVTEYRVKRR